MYNDDPLRQPGPHTRSYTPTRDGKSHTRARTHSIESDKGDTHTLLHSKTGGAGWISLRGWAPSGASLPSFLTYIYRVGSSLHIPCVLTNLLTYWTEVTLPSCSFREKYQDIRETLFDSLVGWLAGRAGPGRGHVCGWVTGWPGVGGWVDGWVGVWAARHSA